MFPFGKNWQSYARYALTPERIDNARKSFDELFDGIELQGKSFLDVGFGQGLSLLLAQEQGAEVFGIDADADNLEALKTTASHFKGDRLPETRIVSILDDAFVASQGGKYDVVHSWGVLHHTGDMRRAINNAARLVSQGGYFVIAIYNRHWSSPAWRVVKWAYNKAPSAIQKSIVWVLFPFIYAGKWLVTFQDPKVKQRGMDFYYDLVDWVGGYPYEYAKASTIQSMVSGMGFECLRVIPPVVPTGCNEFVFRKL